MAEIATLARPYAEALFKAAGADATALDGRQAVVQAQSLCRLMATKSR